MDEKMCFFIYLFEQYAAKKMKKTSDVFLEWEKHGITQKIYDNYWGYHAECMENAFQDIESLLTTGKYAW